MIHLSPYPHTRKNIQIFDINSISNYRYSYHNIRVAYFIILTSIYIHQCFGIWRYLNVQNQQNILSICLSLRNFALFLFTSHPSFIAHSNPVVNRLHYCWHIFFFSQTNERVSCSWELFNLAACTFSVYVHDGGVNQRNKINSSYHIFHILMQLWLGLKLC